MKTLTAFIFLLLSIFVYSEQSKHDFSYDYSATTKCLKEPQRAHYGGGILVNPEFNNGKEGWTMFGQGAVEDRKSKNGNRFIVAHKRTQSLDTFTQKVQIEKGKIYSFSAWVQVSEGSETVTVVFKTIDGLIRGGGTVIAEKGCWSLLKGGIVANVSSPAEILFESKNTRVDIWVDSVSLQPFTNQQWRSHQETSIEKVRKKKIEFSVTNAKKTTLGGAARVSIKQVKLGFPFGVGINHYILESTDYQNWFASRFTVTAFTNEMKWYSTEIQQGQENYTIADAMVKFAKQNGISIRGHNILWDNPEQQPQWVKNLSSQDLKRAAAKRLNSLVSRYAGEMIAWDVMNENLHFSFFEDKLGQNASAEYFLTAYQLDPNTTMFMNEYNTIEYSKDEDASAVKYVKKIKENLSFPGTAGMLAGIGVQGQFGPDQPNLAYMRSSLDLLATTGLPIWITEVDVDKCPNQAIYLEEILREAYAHPAVKGIVSFAGPETAGFKVMPLTDMNFKNTPAGDVVDKMIKEWKSEVNLEIAADSTARSFQVSLFHGDYIITIKDPETNSSSSLNLRVTKDVPVETVHVKI